MISYRYHPVKQILVVYAEKNRYYAAVIASLCRRCPRQEDMDEQGELDESNGDWRDGFCG
jgi:hypothetical protein